MVESVYEVVRYTKVCIRYNVMTYGKLKELATVWSHTSWISQLVLYFVYTVPYIFIMCANVFV
jgi:hypothetical protein